MKRQVILHALRTTPDIYKPSFLTAKLVFVVIFESLSLLTTRLLLDRSQILRMKFDAFDTQHHKLCKNTSIPS